MEVDHLCCVESIQAEEHVMLCKPHSLSSALKGKSQYPTILVANSLIRSKFHCNLVWAYYAPHLIPMKARPVFCSRCLKSCVTLWHSGKSAAQTYFNLKLSFLTYLKAEYNSSSFLHQSPQNKKILGVPKAVCMTKISK